MKKIPLTQGKEALVDDEDYNLLNSFKWHAKKSKVSWYAVRMENVRRVRGLKKEARERKKRRVIRMHNVILQTPEGQIPHHKDSNGLNNQRYNLQLCSQIENNQYATDKRKDDIPF